MQLSHIPVRLLAVAALLAGVSCTESTAPSDPDTRDATDLRLLSAPNGTPPLASSKESFYAVKGKSAGLDIWYSARPGQSDSAKYLEFRLGAASLDRRPDGTTIANGDSVLITLTVTDPTHFVIDFQPSGLTFSANDQPTLKISYAACGDDLNYDGTVDAEDAAMQQSLSFWRQEGPFQPWVRLSSVVVKDAKEVNAQLLGFTGYALMY